MTKINTKSQPDLEKFWQSTVSILESSYSPQYKRTLEYLVYRECVSMGAVGAQTGRYLGHHLFAPADFEPFSTIGTHGF